MRRLLVTMLVTAAAGCTESSPASTSTDAAPWTGDLGFFDVGSSPADAVTVDVVDTGAAPVDVGVAADTPAPADVVRPVRRCTTSFALDVGRPARSASVAGEWNSFSATANPMMQQGTTGIFRLDVAIPPGDYGYKYVVDGDQWMEDPTNLTLKYVGGIENSRLVVPDCNVPLLSVASNTATAAGALSVDVQYTDGAEGRGLDAASVHVTMVPTDLPAGAVTVDAASATIRIRATGLAPTRYTLRIDASSAGGRHAAQLEVPMWVEATPYQWGDGPLYFVFTDRFRNGNPMNDGRTGGMAPIADWNGGDFAGVLAALREGYFDQLGVRAIWLSPVNANTHNAGRGVDDRLYAGYHGYWPVNPRQPDSHWGSLDELRALNEEAHRHGIRVLYDLVNNQVHQEHVYYQAHMRDGWFNGDGSCVCGGNNCSWDTHAIDCWFASYLPDVNWTSMPTADQMLDDAMWWLGETYADGFRVDAVKHMNYLSTTNLRARLNAWENGNARAYSVGETFTGGDQGGVDLVSHYLGSHGLHAQFDFPLYWSIRGAFASNGGTMGDLDSAVRRSEMAYGQYPMSIFLGNQDVERFMSDAAGQLVGNTRDLGYNSPPPPPNSDEPYERMALAFTFTLTQRGVPLIYYGDEIGMPGAADPDNRRMMRFGTDVNAREQRLLAHVRAVGHLRSTHLGLMRGARRTMLTDGDGYVYARGTGSDCAIVALNRGLTSRTVSVPVPAELGVPDGTMLRDALGGASVTVMGGAVQVPFGVRSSAIYVR